MRRFTASDTETLDCGSCHGCCHQLVLLTLEDLKRGPWDTVDGFMLRRRADGSCVYLDPLLGCTAYERRPQMCRMFHCGKWYTMLSPDDKRRILLVGDVADRDMLASGERHAAKMRSAASLASRSCRDREERRSRISR